MKKLFLGMAAVALLFTACNDDQNNIENLDQSKIDMSDFYLYTDADTDEASRKAEGLSKSCHSAVMLNKALNENPRLYKKMYDIEYQTRKIIAAKKPDGNGNGNGNGGGNGGGDSTPYTGTVNIPVYVHVIYNTSTENISQGQVQSQIDILNEDFSASNSDYNMTPSDFSGVAGNADIQFTLAGITRTHNSRTSWAINNTMKYTSSGGHDVITPETHLNLWVVNAFDGNSTLGFAYYPGAAPAGADGVVIAHTYIGDTGTSGSLYPEFNLGRTTTHEVGHYLNLRHIWGDGRCRQDDLVSDTPSTDRANYYCPGPNTVIEHCRNRDMHMNYMDYVDDACMYMFTDGQVDRMRANFGTGGARETMVQ